MGGPQTGEELQVVSVHDNKIQDMQMSVDGSHLITCSVDNYCKVLDSTDFSILKQYNTERQVNSAALHPYFFHVSWVLGWAGCLCGLA